MEAEKSDNKSSTNVNLRGKFKRKAAILSLILAIVIFYRLILKMPFSVISNSEFIKGPLF